MPVYNFKTNPNYGDGDTQNVAIRAFLGLGRWRADDDVREDGYYFDCEEVSENLEPSGVASWGYYMSPALGPDYCAIYNGFKCSQAVHITANTALPTGYTIGIDVSNLDFITPDQSDRAMLYWDGAEWTEIDSWIGDIGCGTLLYFATQAAISASTTEDSSYMFVWRSPVARVTATDRDNIFLFYHECGSKTNWTDFFAIFSVVGGEFQSNAANYGRTLHSQDVGYNDVSVYAKCRATFNRAGVCLRGDDGTDHAWVAYFDTGANLLWIRRFQGAASVFNASTAYTTSPGTNYRLKFSVYGNNFEFWVSEDGTPISGSPLHTASSGTGATDRNVGFVAHNSTQSYFDDIYVTQRVQNEPTATLEGPVADYRNYYGSRFKQLVYKGSSDGDLYFYHSTAGLSPDGTVPTCLRLDGTDDYVNCGNDSSLNASADALSIEFLGYFDRVQNLKCVVYKNNEYYVKLMNNGGELAIEYGVYVGGAWRHNNTGAWTSAVTLHTWNHIACVYDGAEVRVYLNGVEQAGSLALAGNINTTNNNLYLGWDSFGSTYPDCMIDGLKIYDGVLYTANFTAPQQPDPPPIEETNTMVLYYFDETIGDYIYDKSGNENTGAIDGAAFYWDGYGWSTWISDVQSSNIEDLFYIDPPNNTCDSAKNYFYRFKVVFNHNTTSIDYIDTYYQGEITDFLRRVDRRQDPKEIIGGQALMNFTATVANAGIPHSQQNYDRFFNFDSDISGFSQYLDSGGCFSAQVGYRNEDGVVDYWRPYLDDLKSNIRSVEQNDDGTVVIKGTIGKNLTKNTVDMPLVENVRHDSLIQEYLIKDDTLTSAETEYEKYYCDFVNETGEKTLTVLNEYVGEAVICPDWGADPITGDKDDESVWYLTGMHVHASCSDEKYLYVVTKTAMEHLGSGQISCLQVRRCNKDGTPVEDGIVGSIYCDHFSGLAWDDTNNIVAGGVCTDDDYVYVTYWQEDGNGQYSSVIGRLKKTGQNLYAELGAYPGDNQCNENRIYYDSNANFVNLNRLNGCVCDGDNLHFFAYHPATTARLNYYDVTEIGDWDGGAFTLNNVCTYGVENIRGFGLLKDTSPPSGDIYRCTITDFDDNHAYLTTINLVTGAVDQNTTTGTATDITDIWDDGTTIEWVWNITIIGHYIYGSLRNTEYGDGSQPESHIDAMGIGKLARYGFWLESGHIQCQDAPHSALTDYKLFPYPLIKVGGEQLAETPTSLPMTSEILDTDDYVLDLYSGEIWFDQVPGSDSKSVPDETYVLEETDEVKRLLEIRAYYDFKPCIQYFKAEKDQERWQVIQNVCDAAGYICSPSSNGMLKFRDRYTEEMIELADGYELEHEVMYDEGDNDWIDDGDVVDTRIQFVGEDTNGFGGTAATEAWIEFTAFKDMTIDRIAVYLLPIDSGGGDIDFPNNQYVESLAIDVEMGQMHAVNDHTWASSGTKVKDEWYIPYEDPPNPNTPLIGHWHIVDLDTSFDCTSGVTYGIRFTVDTAVTPLQGAICNWAIGMDTSKTDGTTRYSIQDGTGAWTNDDNHAACRLYSVYEEEYEIGEFGDDTGDIIYSEWQEYQRYVEMTFTPSRDMSAGEILEIGTGDVDFATMITDGYIQSSGYDLRVGYSDDGITYVEIPRVAIHLDDANNGKIYFAAQEDMTNGLKYPQTYRLYISNPNAGAPPENVSNLIYDRFNDRDITGGSGDEFDWTAQNGTWYNNYQLMRIGSGAVRQLFTCDDMEDWDMQDMVVEADVWHTGTGNYQVGVLFRYLDNNNYIAAFLDEDDDKVHLKAMHGGVWAGVGFQDDAAFVHGANTTYRIRAVTVDDSHKVYIDGTEYIDYTMNFGDSDTYDEGGLFAGGGDTERMDNFIAYAYYGAQPSISDVTTRDNNLDIEYDTIKVIPYSRKEVYTRNADYYLSIRNGSLYIRRTTTGDLDDGDYVYAIYEIAPIYDVNAKAKLTRSDDNYGNSVMVIGHRRFPSEVPLTVIKYIDLPPRKATDDPINLTTVATKMQRVYGSKQTDWRDDKGEFEEDVDLSAFGADFEFDEPYIIGDPVTVVIYGDPSEWFGIYEVPFNYPLPAGYDNGNWDGEEVWDLIGFGREDLYFKAVRTGYAGNDGADFINTIPPQSIRIGNYKEWRKRLGAMYYVPGVGNPPVVNTVVFDDGNGAATYSGTGWYWRLKHMNDNYGAYGTKLLYYPHRIEVLSANTSTYEELVRQQRKDLYIEVTPIDELGAVLMDDDAVDPNSGAIADEHKVHVFAIEPSSDGVKIRAANRTGTDQRLRVKISGYQANIKKVIQVQAQDQDEIDAQGQRKLPDYENEFITSYALAYRRAHEILALGVNEEQFLRDVPFYRLHLDAEVYDTVSVTDKDNRIYKVLFKLMGVNDTITIDGISQSKATGLMRMRYQ